MTDPVSRKERVIALFNRVSTGYDQEALRYFPFCADRLIARLKPAPGEKILDVASGTGAVALAAAQAVGTSGRVTAIDLAESMLDRLVAKAAHLQVRNLDVHVMDAEALEFRSNYFHHVVCGFGIFFMSDIAAALAQWVRVTRPGGRVVFSAFGPRAFQPMAERLLARLQTAGVETAGPQRTASERLQDPGACQALLEGAGLIEVSVATEAIGYHLPNAEAWWDIVWSSGLRGLVERLPADDIATFRSEHLAEVRTLMKPEGLWLDVQTHFAGGRKPGGTSTS